MNLKKKKLNGFKILSIFSLLILIFYFFISSGSLSSTSVIFAAPTIINEKTSISLPSGSQVYIYGAVTGGASPTGALANNEIRYQTVTDANGNVAAELAMTSSDSNSFGTSCLNYAIGGIGVSDFASYNVVYGYNNSYGADSVSVQFNLPNSASLIIMALASGGQNIVTVSGIPGLSVEASNNNGNEGFLIGIASLSAGNYTLTETSSSSSIPGPGNMVDFVGIYEFFESQVSQLSAVSSVPLWAFNGAYADYNMELSYNGVPLSIPVDFNISNVNDNAGTFYVYTSYGGSLTYLSYGTTATFSSPSPFPAISQSDLSYLNSGVTPPDMQGAQVKTGISVCDIPK